MTNIELARKALKFIKQTDFKCLVSASEGGQCGEGWCDDAELTLSVPEIMYLLSNKVDNTELFKNVELKEIDLDCVIANVAYEAACPEGGPQAYLKDIIASELSDLDEMMTGFEDNGSEEDDLQEIREELADLQDGDYTFNFDIKDAFGGYYIEEDVKHGIELTADQARGILFSEDRALFFEGLSYNDSIDECTIEDKATELGFAENYDYFSYSGHCDDIESYLEAWSTLLNMILDGDIAEDSLSGWLEYFDNSDNYGERGCAIEDWHEEKYQRVII